MRESREGVGEESASVCVLESERSMRVIIDGVRVIIDGVWFVF